MPMRLACFEIEGRRRLGSVTGDTVTDLGAADGCGGFQDLLLGSPTQPSALGGNAVSLPLSSVTLLPPIASPATKVLALGWAYKSHQDETGHKADPFPFFFLKHAQSLVGHRQPIMRPSVSESYDFEGEFVVIIGKPGRHISESQAMEHVAGYSIRNVSTTLIQPGLEFRLGVVASVERLWTGQDGRPVGVRLAG